MTAMMLRAAQVTRTCAIGPDMGFVHAPDDVEAALAADLRFLLLEAASIRAEPGETLPGLVAVASEA